MRIPAVLFLSLFFVNSSNALVLCAANGGVANQVTEGATVVVRTSCLVNETVVTPFTLSSSDFSETINRDKTSVIGGNSTSTVGENRTETVGRDESIIVGGKRSEIVGGQSELQIGASRVEEIGVNHTLQVDKDETLVIGGNSRTEIAGTSQQVITKEQSLSAKRISLTAADQIMLKTGKAMIVMKKNGDVTITGVTINVKGSGNVVIKGSKVSDN